MIIEKINYNGSDLIHLISSEGKILTKGGIYSESVYLGVNDSPFNWIEIDIQDEKER